MFKNTPVINRYTALRIPKHIQLFHQFFYRQKHTRRVQIVISCYTSLMIQPHYEHMFVCSTCEFHAAAVIGYSDGKIWSCVVSDKMSHTSWRAYPQDHQVSCPVGKHSFVYTMSLLIFRSFTVANEISQACVSHESWCRVNLIILTRINLLPQPYGCGHSLCRPDRVEMVRIGGQERVWTPWILGYAASIDGSLTTTH